MKATYKQVPSQVWGLQSDDSQIPSQPFKSTTSKCQRCSTRIHTCTQVAKLVPVPEYHCGTRTHTCTRVSTWLGRPTRTHTHFIVPVPVPEYPLWHPYPCFNMAWYPYSYPCPFHCTRTRVPVLVPVPIFGTRLQLWKCANKGHFRSPFPMILFLLFLWVGTCKNRWLQMYTQIWL